MFDLVDDLRDLLINGNFRERLLIIVLGVPLLIIFGVFLLVLGDEDDD